MRISVPRESLKQALDVCGKVVNQKAAGDVLRCVRIEASNDRATISATNLEEWVSVALNGALIKGEGACILNFTELKIFVKDAGHGGDVEIEANGSSIKVSAEIAGSRIARDFKVQKLEDWPEFPKQPNKLSNVPSGFLESIRKADPSVSSKDFRRALACVFVSEGLAVATDGHHLVALPCANCFETSFLLKPSKMLDHLKGECRAGIETPEKSPGKLSVVSGNISWTVALSDAQYPSFRQVVPNEKTMHLSILFDAKNAADLLRAIPALKSNEGAIAMRCGKDGVFAGITCDLAAFKTDALFSGSKEFRIELSASNLSRALKLGMTELLMSDAFSPVLFRDGKGAFMASMPLRQKSASTAIPKTKEESTMNKHDETPHVETATPPSSTTQPQGFNVVKPQGIQADPLDDLLKSAEEAKATARANYEAASLFARKLRDVQASIKRREREQKSTRELIEKLKTASGF